MTGEPWVPDYFTDPTGPVDGVECEKCGGVHFWGKQYPAGSPGSWDGVSEWVCEDCGSRYGRWTHKMLADGEHENRYGHSAKV